MPSVSSERVTTEVGDGSIVTLVDGVGPALVVLPSYGRDGGLDYDDFAARAAAQGWRVLRPQPRGALGCAHGSRADSTVNPLPTGAWSAPKPQWARADRHCRAMAIRRRSSGVMKWSAFSAASSMSICTHFTLPLNELAPGA